MHTYIVIFQFDWYRLNISLKLIVFLNYLLFWSRSDNVCEEGGGTCKEDTDCSVSISICHINFWDIELNWGNVNGLFFVKTTIDLN